MRQPERPGSPLSREPSWSRSCHFVPLIDPVWGGVYQYSTFGDWDHPHFEKLTTIQGEYLRIYSLAYAAFE